MAKSVAARRDWREHLHANACHGCGAQGHAADAAYCRYCGAKLD